MHFIPRFDFIAFAFSLTFQNTLEADAVLNCFFLRIQYICEHMICTKWFLQKYFIYLTDFISSAPGYWEKGYDILVEGGMQWPLYSSGKGGLLAGQWPPDQSPVYQPHCPPPWFMLCC